MLPSPDILNNYEGGRFVLANLAAKRAKQLREGAMPLVQVDSPHPLTIALAEIAAGKIKPIMDRVTDNVIMDGAEISLITDQHIPGEFGMLLPALDETEVALVTELDEHDADLDEHEGEAELSLTDLVVEEEEEAAVVADDEPLSLNEMQEQESADEDEEPEA